MEKTIVVLDDSKMMLNLLQTHLKEEINEDISIKTFVAGFQLIKFLKATEKKNKPKVIILDYVLYNEDGIDLCKKISPDIKKILISNEEMNEKIEQALSLKVINSYMNKIEESFLDNLIKKVQQYIIH